MDFYLFVLGVLCTWRFTHLLQAEDGPWDSIVRLRRAAGDGFWGELLDCFHCLSIWVALPLALFIGQTWSERLLLFPALSAAAILLERITTRTPPAPFFEEPEDAMLRPQESQADQP